MPRSIIKWLICAALCSLPFAGARAQAVGAVYAMTNSLNSAGGNQILVFGRNSTGSLTLKQTAATGGGGSGMQLAGIDALGSQSGIVLDGQHHMLFVVNTETVAANSQDCQQGTITSFVIGADGTLTIAGRIASGGMFPNSLTITKTTAGNVLYVLNAGGPGNPVCAQPGLTGVPNITGFTVDAAGKMSLLPDSVQAINPGALNGTGSGENCPPTTGAPLTPQASFFCGQNPPAFARSPSQVRFSPSGTQLLVTVKGTNSIYVFPIDANGNAGVPTIFQASTALPSYFGFTFDKNGHLLVTELFGKATSIPSGGAGAVSSFSVGASGALTPISASIGNGGTASCWVAIEPTTGKYAYVSNNLSNTIASYSVGSDGSLTLISGSAAASVTTSGPNDLVVVGQDSTSSYLYELNAGDGTVGAFKINLADGSLTSLGSVSGLPANVSAQGLTGFSQPFPTALVAAILPSSRSVQVGNTATAFATVMNTGSTTASACSISPSSSLPATFNYQTTNSTTNALTGSANTAVDIAGGGSQSFVIGLTPSAAITSTDVGFNFGCANQLAAATTKGVDTLMLTASTTPVPDIVSLAGTASNDGILHVPGASGTNAFVVATANVGVAGTITATAATGSAALPLALTVCQTNPTTSACLAPPSSSTTLTINQNSTPTFAIFGQSSGAIPFDPANSRIFVKFTDSSGVVRGSTSVAVETQ